MDCHFDQEIVERSVNGKIDELERLFLDEHIKVCSSCKNLRNELLDKKIEEKKARRKNLGLKLIRKAEPTKAEPTKAEQTKAEQTEAEQVKTEPTKVEQTKAEQNKDVRSETSPEKVDPVTRKLGWPSTAKVILLGATAWMRVVPFREIAKGMRNHSGDRP